MGIFESREFLDQEETDEPSESDRGAASPRSLDGHHLHHGGGAADGAVDRIADLEGGGAGARTRVDVDGGREQPRGGALIGTFTTPPAMTGSLRFRACAAIGRRAACHRERSERMWIDRDVVVSFRSASAQPDAAVVDQPIEAVGG